MFREMRRSKQQVTAEDCKRILLTEKRGVLSVIGDGGYPYGIPINFLYDENDGRIYFHCAKEGHKLDAIRQCDKVCFTTWDCGRRNEGDWACNVTSVVAMGTAELLGDREIVTEQLRKLALKYYPSVDEAESELHKAVDRVQIVAMNIRHMTGKLVHEK